jgi:hypothetical protein
MRDLGLLRFQHEFESQLTKQLPERVSFDRFRKFFLEEYGEQVSLSESVNNRDANVIEMRSLLDVTPSTLLMPYQEGSLFVGVLFILVIFGF